MLFLWAMALAFILVLFFVYIGVKEQRKCGAINLKSCLFYLMALLIAIPWLVYLWLFVNIMLYGV